MESLPCFSSAAPAGRTAHPKIKKKIEFGNKKRDFGSSFGLTQVMREERRREVSGISRAWAGFLWSPGMPQGIGEVGFGRGDALIAPQIPATCGSGSRDRRDPKGWTAKLKKKLGKTKMLRDHPEIPAQTAFFTPKIK